MKNQDTSGVTWGFRLDSPEGAAHRDNFGYIRVCQIMKVVDDP